MKVVLDRSGIYCATSCTDKTLAIYDYHTGELMATMAGTVGKTTILFNYDKVICSKGSPTAILGLQFQL